MISILKTCRIALVFSLLLAFGTAAHAQFWSKSENPLLPEDEAFKVSVLIDDNGTLNVDWSIAQDYYMYRDQFVVESITPGVSVGDIIFPEGVTEDDPEFGEVVVYFFDARLKTAIIDNAGSTKASQTLDLVLKGQGCNKPVGICYPPLVRNLSIEYSAAQSDIQSDLTPASPTATSETPPLPNKSFLAYMLSALFAGFLLSFTPCVLPMIPILAGVIAGQQNPSKMKSGWLAICYVFGTVVTYIVAGALAGATGAQLQAYFQNVWVISAICLLLIVLAGSLFGLFKIQVPSAVQTRLNSASVDTRSASFSSFVLGLISALVVGACVSPILIVTLGAAITQGDPLLGAAIMGSMAVGMGSLLILFGFGAGWILPKAGAWMNHVQVIFGFMVLGVAIYLLSALPWVPSLYLWAALLLSTGFYCWQLGNALNSALMRSLTRAISAAILIWGAMSLLGGTLGGSDILNPLNTLKQGIGNANSAADGRSDLHFTRTTKLSEVHALLAEAKRDGKPVLIDFYADWCLDCKRMHRTTFTEPSVKSSLESWSLIEIDVTDTNADSQQAKRFFNIFGPPATLFYNAQGLEIAELRQYGYLDEDSFLALVTAAAKKSL